LLDGARQLLKRGLPFYGANLLASLIFYPLLLQVASGSGLAEVGYLRVGQILQQLFAFLPATLVPVLFLQLRGELDFHGQVKRLEIPLRLIWLVLLVVLLIYCLIDQWLLGFLFGAGFEAALLPTRLLLLTALLECLAQLIVQPLLAQGRTRLYGFWQNSSALLAALVGWLWIPKAGLAAYLLVRLLYVLLPLLGFSWPVLRYLQSPEKMLPLSFLSLATGFVLLAQVLSLLSLSWSMPLALFGSLLLLLLQWSDVRALAQRLMPDHL
jgi:O-antigen/teichoic acid export membrane protein